LAGLALLIGVPNLDAEKPAAVRWEFFKGEDAVVDVVAPPGGEVGLLFLRKGPAVVTEGDDQPRPLLKELPQKIEFRRLFCDRGDTLNWAVVTFEGDRVVVRSVAEGGLGAGVATVAGTEGGTNSGVEYYQDSHGAIWVISVHHGIWRVKNGAGESWRFVAESDVGGQILSPLRVVERADGLLCFYSALVRGETESCASHLLLWKNGTWRRLELPATANRVCAFSSTGKLLVASDRGVCEVDVDRDGQLRQLGDPPRGPYTYKHPSMICEVKEGVWAVIWTRELLPGVRFPDKQRSDLFEWSEGRWRLVDLPPDAATDAALWPPRAVAASSDGVRYWGTLGGGIIYRNKEGRWGRLAWAQNMPLHHPRRMAVDHRDWLWVVGGRGDSLAIDRVAAEQLDPHGRPGWSEELFEAAPVRRSDGIVCGLATDQNAVVFYERSGRRVEPVDSTGLVINSLTRLLADTRGGIWLVDDHSFHGTAYYDGVNWTVTKGTNGSLEHVERAFETMRDQGAGFRIGSFLQGYGAAFSGDGRIAFRNPWGRVHYFNGTRWFSPPDPAVAAQRGSATEVAGRNPSRSPFFHNGMVAMDVGGETYVMENDSWETLSSVNDSRPWRKLATRLKLAPEPDQSTTRSFPTDCPLERKGPEWALSADGWVWAGNADEIACHAGMGWIRLPISRTPLFRNRPSRVWSDARGDWWFLGSRTVRLRGEDCGLRVESVALLDSGDPGTTLSVTFGARVPLQELRIRFRVNGSAWQLAPKNNVFRVGLLPVGRHLMEFEAISATTLFSNNRAAYTFETTHDVDSIIATWIQQLGAPSFPLRQEAQKKLTEGGKVAEAALRSAATSPDPEVRARTAEILRQLSESRNEEAAGLP
jgi:hypothetical protein